MTTLSEVELPQFLFKKSEIHSINQIHVPNIQFKSIDVRSKAMAKQFKMDSKVDRSSSEPIKLAQSQAVAIEEKLSNISGATSKTLIHNQSIPKEQKDTPNFNDKLSNNDKIEK